MDFFARQEHARRSTRWLLAAFLACVVLVVVAVFLVSYHVALLYQGDAETARVPAVLIGLATLLIICGGSLYKTLALRAGGGVVAQSLGGARVTRGTTDPALRRLHNVVEEMSIAAGISMPEVYVLEREEGINAFAAGNSPADAAIAVTRGALTRLNREELQGVIAHEFSHVLNGDMRLNSKLLGWVFGLLVIVITARMVFAHAGHGSRRDDKGGWLWIVGLAVIVLGYIGMVVARVLQAAVSRHRERLADASAVQFTRNPEGLKGALLKIAGVSTGSKLDSPDKEEVAHMLFAPGMSRLLATHPPIAERIAELDPSFKRQDLKALAAAAAIDAERLRLDPVADDSPRTSAFAPSPVDASAARVAALTGTFDEIQQAYAREARQAIPQALHAFADSPDAARVLLFALLRGADEQVAARQDALITGTYGPAMSARVHAALPAIATLPPALRLPSVQQLLPAVRRMTGAEREELRDVTRRLVEADQRIDIFECCLALLLESAMNDELEGRDEHGSRTLRQSAAAARVLFAVLAYHGARDAEASRHAYLSGAGHALGDAAGDFTRIEAWPEALHGSLRELAILRPTEKKALIEGLVRTVAHDRRLSVVEGELLRTVCATLHCPLPPILSAG